MAEPEIPQGSNEVSESWQQMVQAVLAVALLIGAVAMFHYYAPVTAQGVQPDELQKQVHQLTQQVAELEKEQAMPALVLSRYRNSIGYIYGVYQIGFANQPAAIRARASGTGFLVASNPSPTKNPVWRQRGRSADASWCDSHAGEFSRVLPRVANAGEFDTGRGFFHERSGRAAD